MSCEKTTTQVQLEPQDNIWIEQIRGEAADREWLHVASVLVNTGDQNMRGHKAGPLLDQVTDVRRHFYGDMLGMSDPENPLHRSYERMFSLGANGPGVRTGQFVQINRIMAEEDVPVSLFLRHPANVTCDPESIKRAIDQLKDTGASILKVMKRYDTAIRMSHETRTERLDKLTSIVETPGKLLDNDARVLSVDPDHINSNVDHIDTAHEDIGLNGNLGEFIVETPILLYSSPEKVDATVRLMADHGESANRTLREAVRLGNYAVLRHVICIADGQQYNATNIHATFSKYSRSQASDRFSAILSDKKFVENLLGVETTEAVYRAEAVKSSK